MVMINNLWNSSEFFLWIVLFTPCFNITFWPSIKRPPTFIRIFFSDLQVHLQILKSEQSLKLKYCLVSYKLYGPFRSFKTSSESKYYWKVYCKFCLNIAIYLRNSFGFWIRVGIEPMDELAPTDALWFVLDSEFIYGA